MCVCVGVCGCAVCGCVVCVVWVAHISLVKTKKLRFFRIFFPFLQNILPLPNDTHHNRVVTIC